MREPRAGSNNRAGCYVGVVAAVGAREKGVVDTCTWSDSGPLRFENQNCKKETQRSEDQESMGDNIRQLVYKYNN